MIISRTPFRISFFGGGTDYPVWFKEHGGAVLSTTIDKYCYLTCRHLPPFFKHKHRIAYSKIDLVKHVKDITHPAAKACFEYMKINKGIELHHDGDLPARTGLGSSSAFTVGLLHSLYALKGQMPTKEKLAKEAIVIEQDRLNESVGCQDQVAVACGGFNKIVFKKNGDFELEPIILPINKSRFLQKHLMLYFTGFSRIASKVAEKQIKNTPKKESELSSMQHMVDEAVNILTSQKNIDGFGKLLKESWEIKKSLTNKISTPQIDLIFEQAYRAGAIGGKLLGAGGGGFIVLFVKPKDQPKVRQKLKGLLEVNFNFEFSGTQIIFYQGDTLIS